jgi:hypothetical protein
MPEQITDADLELLAELGIDTAPVPRCETLSPAKNASSLGLKKSNASSKPKGRRPQHGEDCDIFERLYAVRLDRLRESAECRELLHPLDTQGLLDAIARPPPPSNRTPSWMMKRCWPP